MTSPVGGARVEITGDVSAFASNVQGELDSILSGIDVTPVEVTGDFSSAESAAEEASGSIADSMQEGAGEASGALEGVEGDFSGVTAEASSSAESIASDFEDAGQRSGEAIESSSGVMRGALLGVTAAIAGAVAGATGMVTSTVALGDELDKTSASIGVTTDFLQDLRFWADQNGVSSESLERATGRLNQRLDDGSAGANQYVDAIQALGVATQDANGQVRESEDVFRDTISALMDIEEPSARVARATEIFGDRVARDLAPALRDGTLTLADATAAMDDMGRMSEDQIGAAVQFSDSWSEVKTELQSFLVDAGAPIMAFLADRLFPVIQNDVLPVVREVIDAFGEWASTELVPRLQELGEFLMNNVVPAIETLVGWVVDITSFLVEHRDVLIPLVAAWATFVATMRTATIIQTVVTSISALTTALRSGAAAQWLLNAAMAANPIGLVVAAIAGLVAGLTWFFTQTETGQEIWENFTDFLLRSWDWITDAFDNALGFIGDLWESTWGGVRDFFTGMWDGLVEFVESGIETYIEIITGGLEFITDLWETTWTAVRDFFTGLWDGLVEFIQSGIDTYVSIISGALEFIADLWSSSWDRVTSLVSDGIDRVRELISGIPGMVRDFFSDAADWLTGVGRDIMAGLARGIRDSASTLVQSAIEYVVDLIPDWAKGPLGISSPSSVMRDQVGREIMHGIEEGIEDERGNLENQLRDITDSIEVGGVSAAGTFQGRASGGDGAGVGGGGMHIENLHVHTLEGREFRLDDIKRAVETSVMHSP